MDASRKGYKYRKATRARRVAKIGCLTGSLSFAPLQTFNWRHFESRYCQALQRLESPDTFPTSVTIRYIEEIDTIQRQAYLIGRLESNRKKGRTSEQRSGTRIFQLVCKFSDRVGCTYRHAETRQAVHRPGEDEEVDLAGPLTATHPRLRRLRELTVLCVKTPITLSHSLPRLGFQSSSCASDLDNASTRWPMSVAGYSLPLRPQVNGGLES